VGNKIIFVAIVFLLSKNVVAQEWTWTYHFCMKNRLECVKEPSVVISKKNIPDFTQLILSWNSQLLPQGHFKFYGRIRNNQSKVWYEKHHMFSWGKNIHQSYLSIRDGSSSHHYVRLEAPQNTKADAFEITVEACDGADVKNLDLLSVCTSDLTYKKPIDGFLDLNQCSSVRVMSVPSISQMQLNHPDGPRMCSPTSLTMLIGFCNGALSSQTGLLDPISVAQGCFDSGLGSYGCWPFNVASAYLLCSGAWRFAVKRLDSATALYGYLSRGLPVVVSIRGPLPTMPDGLTYKDGHLLVIVGWDQERRAVLCHDPAFPTKECVEHAYDSASFWNAWARSNFLAYVCEPVS
jgi:hypothetical protein